MTWVTRPRQQVEDGLWHMTAINHGQTVKGEGIEVTESAGFDADISHGHGSAEDAEECAQCQEWARKFRVTG